jgi:hypothetical protein
LGGETRTLWDDVLLCLGCRSLDLDLPSPWQEEKKRVLAEYERKERMEEEALAKLGRVKKKDKVKYRPPALHNITKPSRYLSAVPPCSAQTKGKDGKGGDQAPTIPDRLLPPMPNFESEALTSSGEDIPMYFTHPQQLLDIFQALEEQNLFLIQVGGQPVSTSGSLPPFSFFCRSRSHIVNPEAGFAVSHRCPQHVSLLQNSQVTEQTLEELKQTFRETQQKLDAKTQALRQNTEELQAQICKPSHTTWHVYRRRGRADGDSVL